MHSYIFKCLNASQHDTMDHKQPVQRDRKEPSAQCRKEICSRVTQESLVFQKRPDKTVEVGADKSRIVQTTIIHGVMTFRPSATSDTAKLPTREITSPLSETPPFVPIGTLRTS